MTVLIIEAAIAASAGVGVWLTERVDRPRRRALRHAQAR